MKKLASFLKFALPIAIIVWLVSSISPEKREALWSAEKNWGALLAAFAAVLAAVCLTFVRWFLLVRALGLRFRIQDAFRLGFLAYLLNFVSLGSVGGDLFKAVFIAREQAGRRTEAVATVVVDRLFGLYALLLLTTTALLLVEVPSGSAIVTAIASTTYIATIGCTAFVGLAMTPGFSRGPAARWMMGLPKIGEILRRVLESVRVYQSKYRSMLATLCVSISAHVLLSLGMYWIAVALFESLPTASEHFLIVPLSNVAGSLPFMPAGLGSFEFAMEELYERIPMNGPGDVVGVLVALTYRVITLVIATVGIVYYWTCRKDVRELLHEAELDSSQESDEPLAVQQTPA